MLRDHLQLSLRTYKTVLERRNLGEPHVTLAGGEEWYSDDERRKLVADADAELAGLGLSRGGRLDSDFHDTLVVLQRPVREYYTWANVAGRHSSIRVAVHGREAVIAIADGQTLCLSPSRPETAAFDFASRLPEIAAAGLHSASCPVDEYRAIIAGKMLPSSSTVHNAKQIRRWVEDTPWINAGQLFAAVRDHHGTRRRSPAPVGWMDFEAGRVLVGIDASGWITLNGAGPRDVAKKLEQLEAALR